jgi:hypothetical protein
MFANRFYWGGLKTPSLDVHQIQGTANQDTGGRQLCPPSISNLSPRNRPTGSETKCSSLFEFE